MKKRIIIRFILILCVLLNNTLFAYAQSAKVAILDFENTTSNEEYSSLGKAISSMIITDLTNSIPSEKVEFFERSQLNKLLDEQKLQKSKDFDAKTAVDFGKLSGVNYVFVGSVFVLDGKCNFSTKLVDVTTSKIILSKEVNGKIESWLEMKSLLAESIAKEISSKLGFQLKAMSKSAITLPESSLLLYAKGINFLDKGEIDSANIVLTELKYTEREFNYTDSQLEKLFELASKQNTNNTLKQKAYILNLHKRISENPEEAWKQIETFWNGPLDEKYPYLEYVFLKNLYELFKNDSEWLNFPVSRHGASTVLGDMILFSIASHANAAKEISTGIHYNEIRMRDYPASEISVIWGEPIEAANYRWALIPNPNKDSIYYKFLSTAQFAYIVGMGSRNEKLMKYYLEQLKPLLEYQFYDFVPSEFYFNAENDRIAIFNPYDVLATLIVLVGDEKIKIQAQKFFTQNSEKKIFGHKLSDQAWYKGEIEENMLILNSCLWTNSTFGDYQQKNWTDIDFSEVPLVQLHLLTMKALTLQTLNKNKESYELLDELKTIANEDLSIWNEEIWQGISVQKLYFILQLKNCICLGKMEESKKIGRNLKLLGVDLEKYSLMHTEFFD